MQSLISPYDALVWQLAMGADEALSEKAGEWLQLVEKEAVKPSAPASIMSVAAPKPSILPLSASLQDAVAEAEKLATRADTLAALAEAIAGFDGCPLKRSARQSVVMDGVADAPILIVGEAPGAEEDLQGIPFCGTSGQLLDKMLAAIGLSRQTNCLITNTVYWRPPGNRTPTAEEMAVCKPFFTRLVELQSPKFILLFGGAACQHVLERQEAMHKMLPHTYTHGEGVPVRVFYHPSYLLRQPSAKKGTWFQLLEVKKALHDMQIVSPS